MTSENEKIVSKPHFLHALLVFLGLIAWLSYALFYLKAGTHGVLLAGIVWVTLNSLILGANYSMVHTVIITGLKRALPALLVFLLIGVVIATFILSGTIATLVYYGLTFLTPSVFLPSGLILCSLMSLATGTSWGTIGTGGIVLIGVGSALGIPAPITAGMVVSGACFGDKMSPVSDTTNLAALCADTNIYGHIKSMLFTTVPTYLITLVAFSIIGLGYSEQSLDQAQIQQLLNVLDESFLIHPAMLLPMLTLFALAMVRLEAEASMLLASIVAIILSIAFQQSNLSDVLTGIYEGAHINTSSEVINTLLNRGGIISMGATFALSFIAISLGAVLEGFGFLHSLLSTLLNMLKRTGELITGTIVTAFATNMALGESYIATILTGQLFKQRYKDAGIRSSVLSRSLEEGSTLLTPLIPWTTSGIFFSATLGVSVQDYAGWALLNWINPLMGITFAWLGIAIFKVKQPTVDIKVK